jgi:tRNA (adenine57-N1/adenine58-N1)-methyltransferase
MKNDTSTDLCEDVVCEERHVLIYIDERRRYVIKIRRGERFSSDKGYIDHDDLIGLSYGSQIKLSSGVKAYVLKPSLEDLVYKIFRRPTQVLYPKDLGLILVMLDLSSGKRVLEAGVGSGVATAFLARAVAPNGRVYGYEIREDFAETALDNLSKIGLDRYVEIKIRDVSKGVDEKDLDAALIDLSNPWDVTEVVYEALRPGAPVIFFLPTINQVEKLLNKLYLDNKWILPKLVELLEREYETKTGALRPKTVMISHTGYLIYTRKILNR